MNERIKELMTESGMIEESQIPGRVWTTGMNLASAEKFAALIVNECMKVCNQPLTKHMLPSDHIKEHFGVEE